MENSKKYMQVNGGMFISFQDGAAHTVKLLKDKEVEIADAFHPGKTTHGMKYLVEENGEQKTIQTGSVGLISKLVDCESGDVVTIQMLKRNMKSYYTVTKAGKEVKGVLDEETTSTPAEDVDSPADISW